MELPRFRYHPDPLGTGSVEITGVSCASCRQERHAVYTGPVYAETELDESLCPWCIADGSAHEAFDVEFIDAASIGRGWEPVTEPIVDEVAYRTPGFAAWQQERWFTHCGDAAAFLGQADGNDLTGRWKSAAHLIRAESSLGKSEWADLLQQLAKGKAGSPTAYVFECLRCGQLGGYWDGH
jgi:uncharacterized protein CbrC (UPF0167 family)